VFHLNVALFWNDYTCFSGVSDVRFNCFGCMLQVFHLDVAKVDLMLHMLQWDPFTRAAWCWVHVHARGCGRGASGRRGEQYGRR
jgi:hypothetical protein